MGLKNSGCTTRSILFYRIKQSLVLAAVLGFSAFTQAAPFEISGVKVPDVLEFRGVTLPLNGAGIRYKAVFKVYVAALYVGRKSGTLEEVLSAKGPKRLTVTLMRDIDANELGRAFFRGFDDNTSRPEAFRLAAHVFRLGQIFAEQKKLLAGESFSIDWIPGVGTALTVKGVVQGEPFKEVEFFNALMRIWLGAQPADWKLKDALLGVNSTPAF